VPFIILLAAAAAPQTPSGPQADTIVVTASREAVPAREAAVSATVFDRATIEALALPLTSDMLRLAPGVSVAASGPRGTQVQLRIRGAEANHSLLFVDGIRFNDPAAGNEARFELLTNDALSRVEVVRGPQSALWGSEALGGVIAVETGAAPGFSALGEYGSQDSARASAEAAVQAGDVALSGAAGWVKSDGIDSFGAGGDLDGFENRSASLKAVLSPLPGAELGLAGHWIESESEYDGLDPVMFRRADTLDATDNRIFALRGWAGAERGGWSLLIDGSYLDSANRNRLGEAPLNSTFGDRFTAGAQISRTLALGVGSHRLTGAVEHEGEGFRTVGQAVFGAPDQDRTRDLTAWIGEWRGEWSSAVVTDIAVRHDRFSDFADATTFRASLQVRPARGWTLHGGYGEGIARPTFFDLFGFFPGSFVGNPTLRPESSRGWEAGVRWAKDRTSVGLTGFSHDLRDEIVPTFDPATFLSSAANAEGKSRRRGIEVDATHRFGALMLAANYTYLDAEERLMPARPAVREPRRPKHSANLVATGSLGPLQLGGSLAYVGKRRDPDTDFFPAPVVTLGDYVLASLKLGYAITPALEAYARVENAFDADYQDVLGYRTPGRTIYAGLRVRLGR
jgi:vitamin B12 transporter